METKGFVREEEYRARVRVAVWSVIAAVAIAGAKFTVAILTNSLAMYAESGHSAVDGLAVVITLVAIFHASRPPDFDHPFGHGKFESMAALFEILLLLIIGGMILYHAVERYLHGSEPVIVGWPAFAVMIGSIVIEGGRAVALRKAARETGSEALAASSIHFMTDFLDSFVVITGLAAIALGYPKADIIAALFVAGVIFTLCFKLGRQVLSSLTDKAPEGVAEELEELVLSVNGVAGVHDIRVRGAGSQLFTQMHVDMNAGMSLERVHNVLDAIEDTVHAKFPTMHVATHPEPVTVRDEQ